MSFHRPSSTTTTPCRPSPPAESVTFPGSAVVQLVTGHPGRTGATVSRLHPATVAVDDRHVTAVDGEVEWSWMLADLEDVHHGADGPWSIFVVPGVPDHGVWLPPEDAPRFRQLVDARRTPMVDERPGRAPAPPPDPPVVVDLDAAPSAVGEHRPGDAEPRVVAPPIVHAEAASVGLLAPTRVVEMAAAPAPAASTSLAALEARGISAWFGTRNVLDRVSLTMPAGQVTALIGPSGCGKSTFLRILNRMHELIPGAALAGEVLLDGRDVYDPSRKITEARRHIGMVFQKPNPFPAMSIYDNVVASLQLTGTKATTEEKDELVESCLSKAGLWTEVRDRLRQPGGGLSGGQQQRLCIARALAIRPRVLLMDEPCSALDPTSTRRIEQTIQELASEVTIVIVTHNMQQAQRVSHRCAFFLAEQGTPGVIIEHGPTEAMFSTPQDPRTNDYVHGRFG